MLFRRLLAALSMMLPLTAAGEKPVLEVLTSEYPPYEFMEDGQVVGTDTRLVREVLADMGYEADIRILPWARAEKLVREGKADMLYSLTYSEARNRHYFFTDPISTAQDVFFKRKDHDIQWHALDDLKGLNFGLSAAYSYAPEFMDWLFEGNANMTKITQEQPELTGLRLVGLGRIDLFICEESVCEHLIEQHKSQYPELENIDQMSRAVGPERYFRAGFSRSLPNGRELRNQFNEALAARKAGSDN